MLNVGRVRQEFSCSTSLMEMRNRKTSLLGAVPLLCNRIAVNGENGTVVILIICIIGYITVLSEGSVFPSPTH
jgi:hypothetical protein